MVEKNKVEEVIIGMEKAALERWYKGDPYGYLEMYDEKDFSYFDPAKDKRLDGHSDMKAFYDTIKGLVHSDKYEILTPLVQVSKDTATLSYNLVAYVGKDVHNWNSSSVFKLNDNNQWKVIHTHWSFVRPMDISFDTDKQIV